MHVYPLSIKWEEKLFSAVDPLNEKKEKKTWRTSQGAVFHDRSHHKGKVCPIASVKKNQNKLKTSHMVQQIYLNQLKQFQKKGKTTFNTIENKQHVCQHPPDGVMKPLRSKNMLCKSQAGMTNKMDTKGSQNCLECKVKQPKQIGKILMATAQTMVLSARSRVLTYRDKQLFTLTHIQSLFRVPNSTIS